MYPDDPPFLTTPTEPDPLGFARFREQGIAQLQALCGERWSDFNLHDPGVTLLELVCYGLTDLVYRSGFPVEECLRNTEGRIDGERHALLPPEDALSCRPLTPADYQKLFADRLPEIRNIWVSPASSGDGAAPCPGLLDIQLQLQDNIRDDPARIAELELQVRRLYHQQRNLGEDLGTIRLVEHLDYTLAGDLELDGGRPPAEVLAELYFACLNAISPPIPQHPYSDLSAEEPAGLLNGPYTQHGYIHQDDFARKSGVTLPELIQLVAGIDGVSRIHRLELFDCQGQPCQAATGQIARRQVPRLRLPQQQADMAFRLRIAGHERVVAVSDLLDQLERRQFAANAHRHGRLASAPLSPLPEGPALDLGDYTPLQHHLPPIYGLSDYGIPESAGPLRNAQARQLAGYLQLFDLVLSRALRGIAELPRLYSLDRDLTQSYFPALPRKLAQRPLLYPLNDTDLEQALDAGHDPVDRRIDRRSRALDILLALHGEKFSQRALRYLDPETDESRAAELMRCKLAYLEQAPRLNGQRAAGEDLGQPPAADNQSGLSRKLALLLDLPPFPSHALGDTLAATGFRYLDDEALLASAGLELGAGHAEGDIPLPQSCLPHESLFLALGYLSPALLQRADQLEHYRLRRREDGGTDLLFQLDAARYCRLSQHPDLNDALLEANRIQQGYQSLLPRLHPCHVVEHLLLRPDAPAHHWPELSPGFHHFSLSIALPTWGRHFGNPAFRHLCEETLLRCCPAHLASRVLWLDFAAMQDFETVYFAWRRSMVDGRSDPGARRELALLLQALAMTRPVDTEWI